MRKKYTRPFRPFSSFIFFLLSYFPVLHLTAQTNISTTAAFSNEDSASLVTFNFQNTNSYPVMITDVAGVLNSYGNYSTELWYKTTPVSGAPGSITTANGWTMAGNASVNGIANNTTTVTQPLLSGLNLIIPANSTYGLAIAAYGTTSKGLRVDNAIAATTLGAGGCNIITGPNEGFAGYGAAPVTPAATAKGWIGRITFINGSNCTGTPATPVISGPSGICSGSLFTLSAAGYAIGPGIGYQWQYFNTTSSTWVDIIAATGTSYTATSGITSATQFRLRTTCGATSTQSTSNVLTVNISSVLPGGTYTIDNTLPSSPTNFTSISAAAAALSCGISGPVVFNVNPASGPYTETVTFGKVSGTNAFNTIRLNGHGAILQSMTDISNPVILNLRGTDYMTVDSLNIRSLATNNLAYCGGILLSDTTYYDSIIHCRADLSSLDESIGATYGIGLSGAYYNASSDSSTASYCYIGHNHILGGTGDNGPYYGILAGNGWYNGYNNDDTMNIIAYNEIENVRYCGIYCFGSQDMRIMYNDIHRTHKLTGTTTGFIGIQVYDGDGGYLNNDDNGNVYVIGNRIHDPFGLGTSMTGSVPFWGIYYINWDNYSNTSNETGRSVIANNAVYNINNAPGQVYGIAYQDDYFVGNNNSQDTIYICHNTIDLSGTSSSSFTGTIYGIYTNNYYQQSNNNTVFAWNNMITVTGGNGGTKYGFYHFDNATTLDQIDVQRNNIYVNSSQPGAQFYAHRSLSDFSTLAGFQAAYPLLEVGSLSVNPQYLNPAAGDFTPTNIALMGNGLNMQSLVPQDINGKVRSVNPTPGAFELAADASVTALAGPLGTYCSSVREVKVVVTNAGLPVINTLQLHWTLNGVQQPVVNYTGSIPGANNAPNNTATVTLGNGLFLPNTPVEIKVWSSLPNGQPDGIPANDTLIAISQSSTSIPVDLGPDEAICTGNTKTLNAGNTGASYLWDNNATTQYRTVSAAGTYYVRVAAPGGCLGFDTFHLTLRPLPIVDLGPDREICLGETTTFDAGNPGATYLWDDGSTAQTRTVDTAGYYEVQVTDNFGCMGVDNITVGMKDIPSVDGINATHADSGTYTFYPINPQYALSYTWNFGDGSPEATGYFVQHTYTALGIYTVTLSLVGECTGLVVQNSRTVDVFSVRGGGGTGIGNIYGPGDFSVAPNPARDQITVFNYSGSGMKRLVVYNVLGQVLLDQKAENPMQHRISTMAMANGVYTLRVETSDGYVTRKFEVMR